VFRGGEDVWSVATRSLPVVFHAVLLFAVLAGWLSRPLIEPTDVTREVPAMMLVAAGVAVVASAVVGGVLISRKSERARGIGFSVAASGLILLIIGVVNELWIY